MYKIDTMVFLLLIIHIKCNHRNAKSRRGFFFKEVIQIVFPRSTHFNRVCSNVNRFKSIKLKRMVQTLMARPPLAAINNVYSRPWWYWLPDYDVRVPDNVPLMKLFFKIFSFHIHKAVFYLRSCTCCRDCPGTDRQTH